MAYKVQPGPTKSLIYIYFSDKTQFPLFLTLFQLHWLSHGFSNMLSYSQALVLAWAVLCFGKVLPDLQMVAS